jgi:hypothetical protein
MAPGSINFMRNDDNFYQWVSKRKLIDKNGYYDVVAHGNNKVIEVQTHRGPMAVNHRIAARLIQQNPEYKDQNIRLLSCSTGKTDNGFAQNLANKLGVKVKAPTDILWVNENGHMDVAAKGINGKADLTKRGMFRVFNPGNN